MVCKTDNMWI